MTPYAATRTTNDCIVGQKDNMKLSRFLLGYYTEPISKSPMSLLTVLICYDIGNLSHRGEAQRLLKNML